MQGTTELAPDAPGATPPAPATAAGRYVVNVGLFAEDANAQRAVARLQEAGIATVVQTLDMPRGPRIRVRAGPFGTRAQADAAAARIRALKLDAVVVRQDGAS